jgi:hypothetical protein
MWGATVSNDFLRVKIFPDFLPKFYVDFFGNSTQISVYSPIAPTMWTCMVYPSTPPAMWTCMLYPSLSTAVWTWRVYLSPPSAVYSFRVYQQRREIINVRGQSYVLRLPKYWPPAPTPLTAQRVCTPRVCGGRTHSTGGEGAGGSIFWKTQDTALYSSYIESSLISSIQVQEVYPSPPPAVLHVVQGVSAV